MEETQFIQITEKGKDFGRSLFEQIKIPITILLDNGYESINDDYNINRILEKEKYFDENGTPYTKEERKKLIKTMIHSFIAIKNHCNVLFGSTKLLDILTNIEKTIKSL